MSLSGRQKIHDDHYQTQEGKHTSRSPVQSFGRCFIGKPGGQPCPYKREKDTEQQGRNIRNPSDGKVGTAPVNAVKAMIKTLVPTAVFSS